ncbi:hypothetical protein PAHAL_9G401400 [Panicum hallii]|uniref:Uncharacterized protein n=1 Tax=Panicum hallii TaxID=206008 RepID=A0A2T8I478_9POAL|nr:hypothetical protein PAHAL_9G401400 [Panicum hallii]
MTIPGPPRCQTGSQQAQLAGLALGVAVTHGTRSLFRRPAPAHTTHAGVRSPAPRSPRNHTRPAESETPDEAAAAPANPRLHLRCRWLAESRLSRAETEQGARSARRQPASNTFELRRLLSRRQAATATHGHTAIQTFA